MNIQGIRPELLASAANAQSSPTSANSSGPPSNTTITQSGFLQLIATELQAQDPTQPLDPSQFMGQLVQFGTLNEVTSIYNLLANGASTAASSGSSNAAATAANVHQVSSLSHR